MLRNIHAKDCGKIFTCHCNLNFNSREALLTHQKRKHPIAFEPRLKKKKATTATKEVATTTTSELGFCHFGENSAVSHSVDVKPSSVFTTTEKSVATSRSAATSPLRMTKNVNCAETKEENSNSSSKKTSSWSGDFDDAINLFDSDSKMEFFSTETQTDFTENLFHNNYTQTTFNDLYDFEKFDNQTQTNWNDL